jgi:pimeloyl-ACP methyl ester carboxylesterase
MWVRSVQAWAKAVRIYAVDIIGEPGFSAASRPALRSDAHALWMDDLWMALGLSRASIVGASLGGLLALDYAIRRPARVQKLVLLAPAGIARVRLRYLASAVPLYFMGHGVAARRSS